MLRLAGRFGVPGATPAHDLTFVFYDNEEVDFALNGLGRVARERRGWLYGDLAVLLEPTDGEIEAGCQGTMRAVIDVAGRRVAQRPQLARGQRDPRRRRDPRHARRLHRPRGRDRRLPLPGGAQRGRHPGRGRGQRHPRRVPGRGQLPLRPRPGRGRRRGARARGVRRGHRGGRGADRRRQRRGSAAGPVRAGRGRLHRRRRPPARGPSSAGPTSPGSPPSASPPSTTAPGDPQLAHTREEHVVVDRLQPAEDALIAYLSGSST